MVAAAISIFVLLLLIVLPSLLRRKEWKELAVFAVMGVIALIYMLRFAMNLEVFSFIKSLSEFTQKNLGLDYSLWQGHS